MDDRAEYEHEDERTCRRATSETSARKCGTARSSRSSRMYPSRFARDADACEPALRAGQFRSAAGA